jgi:hypothetical protein
MPKILISYRRADTAFLATTLDEKLAARFGRENVFMDVDSIPAGRDFREHLNGVVASCDVVLAVIDERWLDALDEAGRRRLDLPTDWVRLELETALRRGIPVIPLLVAGAGIPPRDRLPEPLRGLAYRQALALRSGKDFRHDVDMIACEIERTCAVAGKGFTEAVRPRLGRLRLAAGALVLAGFVSVAPKIVQIIRPEPTQTQAPTGAAARIGGTWYAEVPYSWGLREFEQFEFTIAGDRLIGTASFGGSKYPHRIIRGKVLGDEVLFLTRLENTDGSVVTYQYRGHLVGTRLEFTLDNEDNPPTKFVAARTREEATAAVPKLATGGTDPELNSIEAGPYPIDQIKLRVLEQRDAIKQCYIAAEFAPVDHAYVYYLVKIDAAGSAVDVRPPGTDERSVELDRCMDRVLRAVDWGRPPKPGDAEIKLGFTALPAWRSE